MMNIMKHHSGPETVRILERGYYKIREEKVSLQAALDTCKEGTVLYVPEDFDTLWNELKERSKETTGEYETKISVVNSDTLSASQALLPEYAHVACLNFASARNPGGGFLGAARAQEESLARSSGLYASLLTQPEFYAYHREVRSCLYSHRVIFSPQVPVIRDERGKLIDKPWSVSMLTCAAVNVGALQKNEPEKLRLVHGIMQERVRMVLAVAARQKVDALVLGAWGCGVFRNDPEEIAMLFADALERPELKGRFAQVTFAIYNPKGGPDKNIAAFQQTFAE
jgi:uncharacterized protein (TIGR02452 family)